MIERFKGIAIQTTIFHQLASPNYGSKVLAVLPNIKLNERNTVAHPFVLHDHEVFNILVQTKPLERRIDAFILALGSGPNLVGQGQFLTMTTA
ncbi:MAG: hypothetical protein ACF8MJ_02320 [Phycisphaerales bacterium JB050]